MFSLIQNYFMFSKPFPRYKKSAADDFENIQEKIGKISINEGMITEKKVENIVTNGEIACFE